MAFDPDDGMLKLFFPPRSTAVSQTAARLIALLAPSQILPDFPPPSKSVGTGNFNLRTGFREEVQEMEALPDDYQRRHSFRKDELRHGSSSSSSFDYFPPHADDDEKSMHVKNWSRSWRQNYLLTSSTAASSRLLGMGSQKRDQESDSGRRRRRRQGDVEENRQEDGRGGGIRAKELASLCSSCPVSPSLPCSRPPPQPQRHARSARQHLSISSFPILSEISRSIRTTIEHSRLHKADHDPLFRRIVFTILFLVATLPSSSLVEGKQLSSSAASSESLSSNHESSNSSSSNFHSLNCKPGLLLPVWEPLVNLSTGDCVARGIVYFLSLCYLFLGVSIISDRFMGAIEVITSQERDVTIKKPNGETQTISVRVWNETVANLTLMALGSSAPEIMLSVIEIYTTNFSAGDLGPGTIVGSAAYNLFVIIAICVWIIPSPKVKKIKHLRVFCVTMVWSVFAYIWMYAIVVWSSFGVVTIWEGVLTFLFFPLTVGTAYIADRRLLVYKYLSKEYRANKRGVIIGTEGGEEGEDMEMGTARKDGHRRSTIGAIRASLIGDPYDEVTEFERHRMEYISMLKDLRRKNPNATIDEIEQLARDEIANREPKSRAFYRQMVSSREVAVKSSLVIDCMILDLPLHLSPLLRVACIHTFTTLLFACFTLTL